MRKNKITSGEIIEDPAQHLAKWHIKVDFLEDQISKLESLNDFPIFSISVLLLKYQLIEFKLRQLITVLDLKVHSNARNDELNIRIRMPKKISELKITMGGLKNIIFSFEGKTISELQKNLGILVDNRNQLVHSLFEPGDLPNLSKEIELANDVLKDIKTLEKLSK